MQFVVILLDLQNQFAPKLQNGLLNEGVTEDIATHREYFTVTSLKFFLRIEDETLSTL